MNGSNERGQAGPRLKPRRLAAAMFGPASFWFMASAPMRMNATFYETEGGHISMLSSSDLVLTVIRCAADAVIAAQRAFLQPKGIFA